MYPGSKWVWRTPLHLSQPFWEGWYKGLSDLYMTVTAPKVLILAGTDRLDRALTVGQMQGKFQLVLLPQVSSYCRICPDSIDKTHHAFARRFVKVAPPEWFAFCMLWAAQGLAFCA